MSSLRLALLIGVVCSGPAFAQEAGRAASLPPASTARVNYLRDVEPILVKSCARCHARGQSKGGFSLMTRETLLAGGDSGPAIAAGKSGESLLIELVAGLDPDEVMPQKGSRLTAAQVGILRAWIDQGIEFAPSPNFTRAAPHNLDPRQPALPATADARAHPIDRLLAPYYARHTVVPAAVVDDRTFARRVHLDVLGLLPAPDRVDAFVADRRPDKRARLVAALLADRSQYAAHWLGFWNDLLRNDYRGPGYIDGGRRQISAWLYTALANNLPYDRFVADLVNPGPASEGFTRGIIWRGVVNASQMPPMQAAQNVSQVFMGVNLKCASCHDSFINDWQLADAYGLAGVYAESALEMVECDRPTGKSAPMKFLYPGLATIDPTVSRAERLRQLAHAITAPKNGRLSRTIVNRLWARLLGRGLVEPIDDMDRASWHPDLLDWLAEDLVAHGYDLTHTIAQITTSRAYQSRALDAPGAGTSPVFRGPAVRRLSAEQFVDGLFTITGVWPLEPAGEFDPTVAGPAAPPPLVARFVWADTPLPGTGRAPVYFRRTFDVDAIPDTAPLVVSYPRGVTLVVNGTQVLESGDASRPRLVDVAPHLRRGRNVLALTVTPALPPAADAPTAPPVAQGLLVQLHRRSTRPDGALSTLVATDDRWTWSSTATPGWDTAEGPVTPPAADTTSTWRPVAMPEAWIAAPPRHGDRLPAALAMSTLFGRTRAAFVPADPLTTALGRPNREQVVTERTGAPTTLQLLELANGATLAALLHRGAERILAEPDPTPRAIVDRIYTRALSRPASREEHALGRELLGPAPAVSGVEDLLWAIVMLPEFQLIR